MYRTICLMFLLVALPAGVAGAQGAASNPSPEEITFLRFLGEVLVNNLDYAAERYDVSIAEAERAAAGVFPNPQLEIGDARDVTHHGAERMPEVRSIGITQTFELGGKRKARQRVAELNVRASAATLDEFLRNLRLDAATAFAEALATQHAYDEKRRSAAILNDVLAVSEQRLRVGDVSEVDVAQIRIEALQLRNEALASEADAHAARIALTSFLGRERADATLLAVGSLQQPSKIYDLRQLVAQMLADRADLMALRHARDAAGAEISLAKASRFPDLDIGVGMTRNGESTNSIAPSPEFDAVGISFALPIPLFNRNRAEISAASLRFHQAERVLDAAEQKAQVDLRGAYERHRLATERAAQFPGRALQDADQVLEAKRYSYQRGQTTLLDFLEAQRSSSEVHLSYYETLADQAAALIELERAAGLWDIGF